MSLKKLLRRTRREVGDVIGDSASVVDRARRYLEQHTPAITEAGSAAQRLGERLILPPTVYRDRHPNESWNAPLKDITSIGTNLAGEPIAAGVQALTGGETTGPWSDRNLESIGRRGIAGAAVRFGLETATDPLTWIPTSKAPAAAQLGLGALGIGDFGGKGAAGKLTRNLVAGAGMGAGTAAVQEVSDNPLLGMAGGFAGMAAGFGVAGRTPGLRNLMQTEARPRVKYPTETLESPEKVAARRAEERPLVREVTDEQVAATNRRVAELAPAVVPAQQARQLARRRGITNRWRRTPEQEAVIAATGGARLRPDGGLELDVVRFQDRRQDRARVSRGGVFYAVRGGALDGHYQQWGRPIEGTTVAYNPLLVAARDGTWSAPDVAEALGIGPSVPALLDIGGQLTRVRETLRAGGGDDAMMRRYLEPVVDQLSSVLRRQQRMLPPATDARLRRADALVRQRTGRPLPSMQPRWGADPRAGELAALLDRNGAYRQQTVDGLVALLRDPVTAHHTPLAMTEYVTNTLARALGHDMVVSHWGGKLGEVVDLREAANPAPLGLMDRLRGGARRDRDLFAAGTAEPPLTSLHAGPPLAAREAVAGLLGAGAGALTAPEDATTEERMTLIGSGAAAGVLGSAALRTPPSRRLIQKLGGTTLGKAAIGTEGQFRARAGGAGIGAAVGYAQGDTPEERRQLALQGAAVGYGAPTAAQWANAARKMLLQPGTSDEILKLSKDSTSHAGAQRWHAMNQAQAPFRGLEQAVLAGEIVETPAHKAWLDAKIANARAEGRHADADYMEANRLQPAAIRDDPSGYDLVSSLDGWIAKAQLDALYREQEAGDVAAGVLDPKSLRSDYQNRIYVPAQPDTPAGRVAKKPGAKQTFQLSRTYDTMFDAFDDGLRMKSWSIPDLLGHRVEAGYVARAQKGFIDALKATPDAIRTGPAEGYTHLDYTFLKRMFPTFDNAAMDAALDDLASGAITTGQAKAAIKQATGAGRMNLYLRDDIAERLARFADAEDPFMRSWGEVIQVPREMALGADTAMIGRLLPTAWVQATFGSNPVRGSFAVMRALRDSVFGMDRIYRDPFFREVASRHLENVAPGDVGDVLARTGDTTFLQRALGPVGTGLRAVEDWQFGKFVPALKYHVFKAIYDSRIKGKMTPAQQEAIAEGIGRRVDTVLSGVSRVRAGTSRNQETLLRTAFISPTWFRGIVQNVADVGKSGVEGDLARRFWAGMALTTMATSVGLALAMGAFRKEVLGEDWSYNELVTLLDPTEDGSITNPLSRNFMKVTLPDGGNIDLWGPLTPMTRSLLRPLARGVGDGWEAHTEEGRAVKQAIADGIASAFGWENTESLRDWVESRQSIPVSLAFDLSLNKDFRDRVITNAEGNERVRDQAGYIVTSLLPGVFETVLSTEKTALPDPGVSPRSAVRGAAQFFGLNHNAGVQHPEDIKQTLSAFLEQNGVNPGPDPVRTFKQSGSKIPKDTMNRFRADNPNVLRYLENEKAERDANAVRPVGRAAVNEYERWQDAAKQTRNLALRAAADKHIQTGDGDTFRKEVAAAWEQYTGAMDNAAKVIFQTTDRDEVNALRDKAYGKRPDETLLVNRAFDEYNAIRAVDDSPEARDIMLQARRDYLKPGGSADAKYGAGTSARLQSALRDRYRELGGETYARYFDSQQVMGEYAEMPGYLHVDAAAGRRAQTVVSRAQEMKRAGSPLPLAVLVLTDPRASEKDRINALLIVKSGNRLRNPMKKLFFQQHARDIMPFYSDVGWDLLDTLADQEE